MIKVFISYFLLIIVLSSLIIRPLVKEESIAKKFMAYMIFGNFYIATLVFILAYMNIFSRTSLLIVLIVLSPLIYIFLIRKEFGTKLRSTVELLNDLASARYGTRLFIQRQAIKITTSIKMFFSKLFAGNILEWLIFIPLISYNLYIYNINNIEFSAFIAPDEEVHLYWVQSLLGGEIFPEGVYPHAFHNILAAISELFGIPAMLVLKYFGPTMVFFIMTMLYFGLRKIFRSRYPALLGFMLYSLLNIYGEQVTYRFQFIIPQEYGMIMLFPMAIFLLDYIEKKKTKDLVFFTLALSLTIGIHFYTGIIAIILAGSIALVYLSKIIKDKMFFKIFLCGILSIMLALAPLGLGLALGYEAEQSFDWASDVIEGSIYKEGGKEPEPLTLASFKERAGKDIFKHSITSPKAFYSLLGIILATIIYNILIIIIKKERASTRYKIAFALNSLILLFLILFRALKLPTLMEAKRLAIFFAYFTPIWLAMPLELVLSMVENKKLVPYISIASLSLSLYGVMYFNLLRPLPLIYYFQPRGTIRVNEKIMEEYDDMAWTAVSPVNNLSSILNSGHHYEISDFIIGQENWDNKKTIRIPTKYVFVYIDKKPITNYGEDIYKDHFEISYRKTVNKKDASKKLSPNKEENYHYINEREILMSKAYYWAEEYIKHFPKEMEVYYENEDLLVYKIRQNVYGLNNFSIDYGMNRE